jgi:hypothetical protein
MPGRRFCRDFACGCPRADRVGRTLEAIPTCLTETAIVLPSKPLIATATAAGLVGLGAAALLAPGPSPNAPASTSPPAREVRTQVVTHVIHRVRHVTEHGGQAAPAAVAAVPVAAPAPVATPPAVPVRTRASGAGEEREDEHAEREHDAVEQAEEADD